MSQISLSVFRTPPSRFGAFNLQAPLQAARDSQSKPSPSGALSPAWPRRAYRALDLLAFGIDRPLLGRRNNGLEIDRCRMFGAHRTSLVVGRLRGKGLAQHRNKLSHHILWLGNRAFTYGLAYRLGRRDTQQLAGSAIMWHIWHDTFDCWRERPWRKGLSHLSAIQHLSAARSSLGAAAADIKSIWTRRSARFRGSQKTPCSIPPIFASCSDVRPAPSIAGWRSGSCAGIDGLAANTSSAKTTFWSGGRTIARRWDGLPKNEAVDKVEARSGNALAGEQP